MTKPSEFSTEYKTVLPDDYLKVSKSGDTDDKAIKYNDFLDQIATNYINTTVITIKSINSNGDLVLNNVIGGKGFTLKDNSTLIVRFGGLAYNWQSKANINVKLFDLENIPLINGFIYDKFNQQWLDSNTIGNGLIKFVYDNNIKKFKLYKLGADSGTIKESFKDTQYIAGMLNLTDNMGYDRDNYPSWWLQFKEDSSMINLCIAGIEDDVTSQGRNKEMFSISSSDTINQFDWYNTKVITDGSGNTLGNSSLGYGSFSSSSIESFPTRQSISSPTTTATSDIWTAKINFNAPTQPITIPTTIPTNDFGLLPRRYGCYFMYVL